MADRKDEPTELPPLYIRDRMSKPRITGEELAERMGTTPATISRLLNGRRKMTLEWLYAFSKALGVPIEMLFKPPHEAEASPEMQLRAALLAFGVDKDELGKAISAVKIFREDDSDEQSQSDLPYDQPEPASPRHEEVPSRRKSPQPSS